MVNSPRAVLLLSCTDRPGIVARIAHFIFERAGNILSFDQYVDSEQKLFFARVEWSLESFTIPPSEAAEAFAPLGKEFKADWRIELAGERKPRVGIMVSKHLHCLVDLLWRHEAGELDCDIPLIVSNHPNAAGLASNRGIEYHHLPITKENKPAQERLQIELFKNAKLDLIVLARYMQVLTPAFLDNFPQKVINIHHSFLPAFMGAEPYRQARDRGVKIIGATSHYATEELDQGPIIHQDIVRVSHRDNLEELIVKGADLERVVLARAVKAHLQHRVLVYDGRTVLFGD